MRTLYNKFIEGTGKLRDIPLLLFRLILAIGFFEPATMKVKNLSSVAEWFESMSYPLPMMFIMVIATLTVHLPNGFPAGDNGFEIPLYYFLMLFALVIHGGGKYSLDHLWDKRLGRS